jgi:hypothetical protein
MEIQDLHPGLDALDAIELSADEQRSIVGGDGPTPPGPSFVNVFDISLNRWHSKDTISGALYAYSEKGCTVSGGIWSPVSYALISPTQTCCW